MENLVGREVKCITNGGCNFDLNQYYIIVNESETMYVVQDNFGKHKDFPKHKFKYYFELVDSWVPKQGDKVLWSGVKLKDERGIFICKYENYFIVKYIGDECDLENGTLKYAEKIRPYEDEIKVGDWYLEISNNAIRKATNCISENYLNNKNYCKKITNPQLIKLLNEEL